MKPAWMREIQVAVPSSGGAPSEAVPATATSRATAPRGRAKSSRLGALRKRPANSTAATPAQAASAP